LHLTIFRIPFPNRSSPCDSSRGPSPGGHAGLDQVSRLSLLAQRRKNGRGCHWLPFAFKPLSFSSLMPWLAPHVLSRCSSLHAALRLTLTAFRIFRKTSWTRQTSGPESQSRTTTAMMTPLQGAMPPRQTRQRLLETQRASRPTTKQLPHLL
jgi:hypothetical protein